MPTAPRPGRRIHDSILSRRWVGPRESFRLRRAVRARAGRPYVRSDRSHRLGWVGSRRLRYPNNPPVALPACKHNWMTKRLCFECQRVIDALVSTTLGTPEPQLISRHSTSPSYIYPSPPPIAPSEFNSMIPGCRASKHNSDGVCWSSLSDLLFSPNNPPFSQ